MSVKNSFLGIKQDTIDFRKGINVNEYLPDACYTLICLFAFLVQLGIIIMLTFTKVTQFVQGYSSSIQYVFL